MTTSGEDEHDPSLAPAGGPPPSGWRTLLRRSVTALFLLATVVAVGLMLRGQDWSVLAETMRSRPAGSFAALAGLAFAANAAALLTAMLAWHWILTGVNGPTSAVGSARVFFVGQFAKYMPGKVFGYVVSLRMGKAMGVSGARMTSAWLSTLVIGLLTGATVSLLAGPQVLGGSVGWLALAALPIVAVLVRPRLVDDAAALVARLRRRPAPTAGMPGRTVRRALLIQLLSWLLGGVQLWLLAVALGAPAAGSLLLCVGLFSLGAIAGIFAVFTPDGLGVREVILLSALSLVVPLPIAGVIALVSRLVVVLSELCTAAIGLLVTEALHRRAARRGGRAADRAVQPVESIDDARRDEPRIEQGAGRGRTVTFSRVAPSTTRSVPASTATTNRSE
jgi:glycosyltransferase 2 family protein